MQYIPMKNSYTTTFFVYEFLETLVASKCNIINHVCRLKFTVPRYNRHCYSIIQFITLSPYYAIVHLIFDKFRNSIVSNEIVSSSLWFFGGHCFSDSNDEASCSRYRGNFQFYPFSSLPPDDFIRAWNVTRWCADTKMIHVTLFACTAT